MTDQPPDFGRPDDELVSAVLDGEATADERARLEADPALSARLAEFRAISDRVAVPPPTPGDADRDRAIAAAKAARRSSSSNVVPLGSRRGGELPRFLAIAAAIVVVLGAAGFLISQVGGRDDGANDFSAVGSRIEDGEEGADEAGDDGFAEAAPAGSDAVSEDADSAYSLPRGDLGSIEDDEQLLDVLRSTGEFDPDLEDAAPATTTSPGDPLALPQDAEGNSEACRAGLEEAEPELDGLVDRFSAEYQDTPAIVLVYGTTAGGQRVIVVARDECRVLTTIDV
jgi:hypothetical protein